MQMNGQAPEGQEMGGGGIRGELGVEAEEWQWQQENVLMMRRRDATSWWEDGCELGASAGAAEGPKQI